MISAIERYLLESIVKNNNTQTLIHLDTCLEPMIIKRTLESLIERELVHIESSLIKVKSDKINQMVKRTQEQRSLEFNQIIKSSIKNSLIKNKNDEFSFDKVSLNDKDHTIFKGMLKNLEDFLKGIPKNKGKTSNEILVYWGTKKYRNIISDLYNLDNTNFIT
jgi:hypothetical protein